MKTVIVAMVVMGSLLVSDGMAQMKPLKIELPTAMFVGTPKTIKSANLEAPLKGKRAPVMVPPGVENVAIDADVSSSDSFPIIGELELVTDGDKEAADGSYVELGPMKQHVQVDLGETRQVFAVAIWHFHSQARVYKDVVVQLADDEDFITNVRTVFNNDHDNSIGLGVGTDKEYIETNDGRAFAVKGEKAQYVRLYSNGSTSSEMNHYVEVEIYGK
ncbi:MAG: hypothetical protein OSB41_15840 [Kiritimatiellae bacterium]|nr:hypothetical protein [Kiritimatiellia bacterium]